MDDERAYQLYTAAIKRFEQLPDCVTTCLRPLLVDAASTSEYTLAAMLANTAVVTHEALVKAGWGAPADNAEDPSEEENADDPVRYLGEGEWSDGR